MAHELNIKKIKVILGQCPTDYPTQRILSASLFLLADFMQDTPEVILMRFGTELQARITDYPER